MGFDISISMTLAGKLFEYRNKMEDDEIANDLKESPTSGNNGPSFGKKVITELGLCGICLLNLVEAVMRTALAIIISPFIPVIDCFLNGLGREVSVVLFVTGTGGLSKTLQLLPLFYNNFADKTVDKGLLEITTRL